MFLNLLPRWAAGKMSVWHKHWQRGASCFFWGVFKLKKNVGDSQSPRECRNKIYSFAISKQKKKLKLLLITAAIQGAKTLWLPFSQHGRWLMEVTGWVCFKCPEHWTFHTEGAFQQHASLCWLNCLDWTNHLPFTRLFSAHLLFFLHKIAHSLYKLLKHQLCEID